MSEMRVLERVPSVNGMPKRPANKPNTASKKRRARKGMKHARRLACGVGAVGVRVLGLSVVHCTESIGLLTGSLGAVGIASIGIDAGMVVSELAELAVPTLFPG